MSRFALMLTGGALATAVSLPCLANDVGPNRDSTEGRKGSYPDIVTSANEAPNGWFKIGLVESEYRTMHPSLVQQVRWAIEDATGIRQPRPRKVPLR